MRARARGIRGGRARLCLATAFCLGAVWAGVSGASEIYRCSEDGSVVFSDIPCAESAEIHRPGNPLSVVEPADGLEDIAAENSAFVGQRRQHLAEQRETAARARLASKPAARKTSPAHDAPGRVIFAPYRPPRLAPDTGPRNPARAREAREPRTSTDRQTLLSRSGSGRALLRRDPPRYQ